MRNLIYRNSVPACHECRSKTKLRIRFINRVTM